ncbi:MAG: hypothetical protein AAGD06_07050 [Acidobacteriota bacterium]
MKPPVRALAVAGGLVALLLTACTSTDAPAPVAPKLPERKLAFLKDPLSGFPLTAEPGFQQRVRDGHRALVRGDDDTALATARSVLETDPGFQPASVLLAQVESFRGRHRAASETLSPLVEELPGYVPAALLLARSQERAGDVEEAYRGYLKLAPGLPLAASQADQLLPAAFDAVAQRLEDALERGWLDDAEASLATLESWAPDDARTWEGRRRLAVADGDREAELTVTRGMVDLVTEDQRGILLRRLGELEVEVGDPKAGVEVLEELLRQSPEDLALADQIQAAKFIWRLQLLPEEIQDVARRAELSRADLASLLYWLFPGVRYAQVNDPPIAADILDRTDRQQILRVLDLGLMHVDERLHRFEPERFATRQEALMAVLGLLKTADPVPACMGKAPSGGSQYWVCAKAGECRLIDDEGECLPEASISGHQATELARRTLALLGTS